jgi:hypothetical protein
MLKIQILDADLEDGIYDLSKIPAGDTSLTLSGKSLLRGFKGKFDDNFKEVRLRDCESLKAFDLASLPDSLEDLDLAYSRVEELKGRFPDALKTLYLVGCEQLKTLDLSNLPEGLEDVNLDDSGIEEFRNKLPENISISVKTELSNYYYSRSTEKKCKVVDLSYLLNVGTSMTLDLPKAEEFTGNFPDSLEALSLTACKKLKIIDFSQLPPGLQELDLSGTSIEEFRGKFPAGLRSLNLNGAINKKNASENLIKEILGVSHRGCAIHVEPTLVRDFLPNVNSVFADLEPGNFKDLVKGLSGDHYNTSLANNTSLSLAFIQITNLLQRDPKSIEWIDDIAGGYLDGCVNQPISGIIKIASWAEVASKESLFEKLAAVKRVLVQDAVSDFAITAMGGKAVEDQVELGNLLLQKVHFICLNAGEISEAWGGVPVTAIPYQDSVASFSTEENIQGSVAVARKELNSRLEDSLGRITRSGNLELWGRVALSGELEDFKISKEINLINVKTEFLGQWKEVLLGNASEQDYNIEDLTEDLGVEQMREFDEFRINLKGGATLNGLKASLFKVKKAEFNRDKATESFNDKNDETLEWEVERYLLNNLELEQGKYFETEAEKLAAERRDKISEFIYLKTEERILYFPGREIEKMSAKAIAGMEHNVPNPAVQKMSTEALAGMIFNTPSL